MKKLGKESHCLGDVHGAWVGTSRWMACYLSSTMEAGGLYTPRPKNVGILRSPHTPGTGSSVRFGMRSYEDGEESLLTASVSSRTDESDARPPADTTLGGDSLDMSFTESFLRREVDGALAGLDLQDHPKTPFRHSHVSGAPDTVKPLKPQEDWDSPSSPPSPPSPEAPSSTSPLSSPTIRPTRNHPSKTPDASPEATESLPETTNPRSEAGETPAIEASRETKSQDALPADEISDETSPLASSLSHTDTSYGSSSWATPRSAGSPHSPSHWPGMYEFSYLSDKEALDDVDTGPLVPFAAQELSSKLFSIETLGTIDTRELFDMIAALDRTHTERTIFLQHRLARTHRLVQMLRAQLQQAYDRIHVFESHIQEFVQHSDEKDGAAAWETLHALTERLEARLESLHKLPPSSPPSPSPRALPDVDAIRQELDTERRQLENERRDLEIRRAEPCNDAQDEVQKAIEATREACRRDADVRVLVARQEAAEALREVQARLTEAETQPTLDADLERAHGRIAELERLVARTEERRLSEYHALQTERKQADAQCSAVYAELHHCQRERDEVEAGLKAEMGTWQQRVRTLEHDVAHRDLQALQLQQQCDRLSQETHHFALALAAKDQELSMLKRGTKGSAYWDLITQRTRRSERRALQNKTNVNARTTQETVDMAQKVLRTHRMIAE